VNGHKIQYTVLDDQSSDTVAATVAHEAVADNPTAIMGASTTGYEAAQLPLYESAKIPVFMGFANGFNFYPWLYATNQTNQQSVVAAVKGAAAALGGSLKGKRVAIVGIDLPVVKTSIPAYTAVIDAAGGTLSTVQYQPIGAPSFTSGAANVLASKADVAIITDIDASTIIEAKALITAGFKGPMVAVGPASDPITFATVDSAQYRAERNFVVPVPGSLTYNTAVKFHHSQDVETSDFSFTWPLAYMLVDALKKCGYPCAPASLEAAANALGSFTVPGNVLFANLDLTAADHNPQAGQQFYDWDASTKEAVPVGPVILSGPPDYPNS
jgi:ABC-type branched-subunit amino acid transport system substrate-binding protein